ncbi:MAG: hypothetical protein R3195_20500 [Gemmatimonadota bacterium]|nr:hypothetical protein [Gemmatimonadota bacterium]
MPFEVAEIRERAERLKSSIALERYQTRAGLRQRSAFETIYREHRFLLAPEVLPAIQRELAEAEGDRRGRLQALFGWVAGQQVEAQLAPLEDELRAWEAGAMVGLRDGDLPLRRVPAAIARAQVRGERLAWEIARNRRVEEASALQLDVLHREREAVRELGLGDYIEARERIGGLGLRALERQAVEILTRTEEPYREMFLREVSQRLGIEARAASRSDAVWLLGGRWLAQPFALNPLLGRMRRGLEAIGLPLRPDGLRLDLDRRPLKEALSYCAAIRVPGDVVLVVSPIGGQADARGLLHEIGHALHFTFTSASLPWEERALGDTSVTETFALLFEGLTLDRGWCAGASGLTGETLEDYLSLARFLYLYRVRRQAAQFLYEMELAATDEPSQMAPRYSELLGRATGFAHDPQTYIEDVKRGFWVARQLRAAMLVSILRKALHDRFGNEWFAERPAGAFIGELMSAGQRENAVQIAEQLGESSLGPGALVADVERWFRPKPAGAGA